MKEDRLALQKAVDSGDTDLGMLPRLYGTMRLLTYVQCTTSCYNYTNAYVWEISSV
jgi:hypothetical protein